jgi:hypothetical protein
MTDKKTDSAAPAAPVQGEGDYIAARKFQKEEQAFVRDGPVEEKAREAAEALDGPEAAELEAARKAAAKGESVKP